MKIKDEIKMRVKHERIALNLAAKYVKAREYDSAANMYRSAAFHRALRLHLKSRGRR